MPVFVPYVNTPEFFQSLAQDIRNFSFKQLAQEMVQGIQWAITLVWTFLMSRIIPQPARPPVPVRHLYTTQEILQSANRDKSAVPYCPPFFQKWTLHPQANAGTDAIFYKPEIFVPLVMESADSAARFVAKWRRRKLLCTIQKSPTTNESYTFLVEYNPVRLGFQYASDVSIPYAILNQAAMLFVKRFQCLDLYMDTSTCPGFRSPLIDIFNRYHYEQEEQHKEKQDQHSATVLGREALWNRNRRRKEKPREKTEFTDEKFHLNTFFRVRTVQEEWDYSVKAVKTS